MGREGSLTRSTWLTITLVNSNTLRDPMITLHLCHGFTNYVGIKKL